MTKGTRLTTALEQVTEAALLMEEFLSLNAPHWVGYGRHIAELASHLATVEMTSSDLRALQDRAYDPFKGTFGSMHDLSFFDSTEDEYQRHKAHIGRALDAVEQAFLKIANTIR